MYLPYLRGRQFELIGLRELLNMGLISDVIVPIIEPVKLSSTLINTIEAYTKEKHSICVIRNPLVGSFHNDMRKAKEGSKELSYKETFNTLFNNDYVIQSMIVSEDINKRVDRWIKQGSNPKEWLVVNNNRALLPLYEKAFQDVTPKYTLIPDKNAFRRRVSGDQVILEDKFEKQARNKDYQNNTDEIFSEDHLDYIEDDFVGFSDYSIVGNEYIESGFAPFAVVIHIVYFRKDGSLWVKHFVSDSNEDYSDPAGKYYEAVCKLAKWYEENPVELTYGLETFLEHYKNQTYPGLGSVKKLSIMHHLELMNKYLTRQGR